MDTHHSLDCNNHLRSSRNLLLNLKQTILRTYLDNLNPNVLYLHGNRLYSPLLRQIKTSSKAKRRLEEIDLLQGAGSFEFLAIRMFVCSQPLCMMMRHVGICRAKMNS